MTSDETARHALHCNSYNRRSSPRPLDFRARRPFALHHVLLFFISQFIALFTYSNMATIAAVTVGDALDHAGLGPLPLLVGLFLSSWYLI